MSVELVGIPADGGPPEGQLHSTELENVVRALNGAGVLEVSIEVTATGLTRVITIPAFTYWAPDGAGALVLCSYPGGTVTMDASEADPRTDILVAYDDNTVGEVAGVATPLTGDVVEPPMPAAPANGILVAKVAITAQQGPIIEANIQGRAIYVGSQFRAADVAIPDWLDSLRDDYALLALFDAPQQGSIADGAVVGLGLTAFIESGASIIPAATRGGAVTIRTGTTGDTQSLVATPTNGAGAFADRSPYFSCILTSEAADAATKVQGWGFQAEVALSNWTSTTVHKAFFRQTTTGALFAVTGNGSAEQTTSLATTLNAAHLFEVYTVDDGVTWVFKVDGVVVATHTTQVPGVTTGMYVVTGIENNTTTSVEIADIDLIYAYQRRDA
jgi:hypothetical protein